MSGIGVGTTATTTGSSDYEGQLLSLIRDFASERSRGERRNQDLKRRLHDLQTEFEAAVTDLDDAKRCKLEAEKCVKGIEVELSMVEASIVSQQARIRLLQDDITKVGDDVTSLKIDGGITRDEFIHEMYEINKTIRKCQEMLGEQFGVNTVESSFNNDEALKDMKDISEKLRGDKEFINQEVLALEEYNQAVTAHNEVLQVLSNTEKRAFLAESLMKDMKGLHELGQQTAEAEKAYASLGQELRNRYSCPKCGLNNMEILDEEETAEAEKVYASLGRELRNRYSCPKCGFNNMEVLDEEGI